MPRKLEDQVRPVEYPSLPGAAQSFVELGMPADLASRVRALEAELREKEQQFAGKLEGVRHEGLERGKQLAGSEQAAWRQQCAAGLNAAIQEFRSHVEEYLARVEQEVVRLALAVAERILHRESQLDPLLLSGAMRVALGQLAESTQVRLRVPASQQEMWAEMVRLIPHLPLRPEVLADERMQTCEAVLETNLGTVNLGVRAQLEEIERGFFDLPEVRREAVGEASRADAAGKQG